MIATILQREPQDLRESIAVWRQLSDIVAQRGMQLNQAEIYRSLHALARLRTKVPEYVRRDTALSVARHGRFAPLVAFYANDTVSVAAAMLQNARLPDEDWLALLPATHDVARSILAGRADLPQRVRYALDALGAGAVALPANGPSPVAYFADELAAMGLADKAATPLGDDRLGALDAELILSDEAPPADWTKVEAFKTPSILNDMLGGDGLADGDGVGDPEKGKGGSQAKSPISQISELVRRIDRFQSARAKAPSIAPGQRDEIAAIEASIKAELTRPSAVTQPPEQTNPTASPQPSFAAPDGDSGLSHDDPPLPVPEASPSSGDARFLFETNVEGVIHWVEGVAPQLVVGLSIASADVSAGFGVDEVSAGAFRQHAEILNARLSLGGQSVSAGEWMFSAEPMFDPLAGQFLGYHGLARRPLPHENPSEISGEVDSDDSIRQLIHELRSPLNAISGFAQIISGQMFGPVDDGYRTMAETIIQDAATVQEIIEDLHTASGEGAPATAPSDPNEVADICDVIHSVCKDLRPLLQERRVELNITREGGPFLARGDVGIARRMIGRLLTALVDVAEVDSLIVGQLTADMTQDDQMQLRIVRPSLIRFADADQLLDPSFSPDGEAPSADILSLGFSLRLVGSLASANGGHLEIAANAMILHLPLATSDSKGGKGI